MGGLFAADAEVIHAADESFAEKLLDALHEASLQPDAVTRCKLLISSAKKALGISKVASGIGLDLELGATESGQASTLSRAVESVFEKIEESRSDVLIAIDEMPETLLALSRATDGPARVARLLHWLRALRQTHRRHIRWVFLGSIGLEGFVEERLLGKTINDLTSFSLDALTPTEADAFLERLGRDNSLPLWPEIRSEIITRVGWPLPHHLQIVFHALRGVGGDPVGPATVEAAFAELLSPHHLTEFDTWRQRLEEQFEKTEAATAKAILNHLCQHPKGRTRPQILDFLMRRNASADPVGVEEQLARLLQLLQRDGYLVGTQGRYAFRSFLLRSYWHRRFIV
jgi:hypothetical protein